MPEAWAGREFSVAVAFVVDTNGRVEREGLQVVEAPGRTTGRGFYPRIYVVAARSRDAGRIEPASYDAALVGAVTSHASRLRFQPAIKNGRPVRSTVLVACQRSGLRMSP